MMSILSKVISKMRHQLIAHKISKKCQRSEMIKGKLLGSPRLNCWSLLREIEIWLVLMAEQLKLK
jgi:hypothetical protein